MRNLGKGVVEFKKPVALDSESKYPTLKLVIVPYHKDGSSYRYQTSLPSYETVPFSSVIMKVTMTVNDCENVYVLNEDDQKALSEFEKNVSTKKPNRNIAKNSQASHKKHTKTKSIESSEGRVVITTGNPSKDSDPDCRRSGRVRRMVLYEAE